MEPNVYRRGVKCTRKNKGQRLTINNCEIEERLNGNNNNNNNANRKKPTTTKSGKARARVTLSGPKTPGPLVLNPSSSPPTIQQQSSAPTSGQFSKLFRNPFSRKRVNQTSSGIPVQIVTSPSENQFSVSNPLSARPPQHVEDLPLVQSEGQKAAAAFIAPSAIKQGVRVTPTPSVGTRLSRPPGYQPPPQPPNLAEMIGAKLQGDPVPTIPSSQRPTVAIPQGQPVSSKGAFNAYKIAAIKGATTDSKIKYDMDWPTVEKILLDQKGKPIKDLLPSPRANSRDYNTFQDFNKQAIKYVTNRDKNLDKMLLEQSKGFWATAKQTYDTRRRKLASFLPPTLGGGKTRNRIRKTRNRRRKTRRRPAH